MDIDKNVRLTNAQNIKNMLSLRLGEFATKNLQRQRTFAFDTAQNHGNNRICFSASVRE